MPQASFWAVFWPPPMGASTTYYALEIRGGSRVYALDTPVRKGRVYLFHRYPDGVYMSLAAGRSRKSSARRSRRSQRASRRGRPYSSGRPLSGPGAVVAAVARGASAGHDDVDDSGYGYYGYDWGWGGYVPPLRGRPDPSPPSRIGPNGFPILAPPGSRGLDASADRPERLPHPRAAAALAAAAPAVEMTSCHPERSEGSL